jgi:hypothetical protein
VQDVILFLFCQIKLIQSTTSGSVRALRGGSLGLLDPIMVDTDFVDDIKLFVAMTNLFKTIEDRYLDS